MQRHSLPMEVIQKVFERAASHVPTASSICRVCHTARAWALPVLYETIVLPSSSKIERFAYSQMETPFDVVVDQLPIHLVRKMWFGPTSSSEENDLDYSSREWPITLMHQILTRCTALCSLAFINVGQAQLYRLTSVIPKTVSSLVLGPVHGEVDYRHLPCAPNLHTFTSMDTFMLDTEICELVLSSTIRTIRRVYTTPSETRVALAFDQLECVYRASVLERLEIVCYGGTKEAAAEILESVAKERDYDRTRVVLVPRASTKNGKDDAFATLFEDWKAEEYDSGGIPPPPASHAVEEDAEQAKHLFDDWIIAEDR
ncbi:hypothetical protein C8T65DRAFT_679244 [Cerioporus squamosus]|nr:hypothetical protein C8T65DRAFT_679244 [Cerioporus squamosus]